MAPWNREQGPLAKATKDADALKKRTDQVVKESNKLIGNKKAKDKETKLEQMYENAIDTKTLAMKLYDDVDQLKEDQEPSKVKNYDQKRTQELTRLSTMKTQLEDIMKKLLPDTTEEEFLKKKKVPEDDDEEKEKDEKEEEEKAKKQAADEDEEEEEDEEEDDDEEEEDEDEEEEDEEEEDEEEDEEEEEEPAVKSKKAPVLASKKPQVEEEEEDDEEEDEEEEEEEDEEEDEDEEEEDEDEEEEEPTLPTPAKRGKAAKKEEEEEEEDEEEDEDEEEEEEEKTTKISKDKKKKGKEKDKKKDKKKSKDEDMEVTQSTHRFETVDDYTGEEGDLSFKKGEILTIVETREDGWWVAENVTGEKGLVPSTYLQKHNSHEDVEEEAEDEEDEDEDDDEDDVSPRRSGKALWGSIRKTLEETTVSDVLHAMGAVPSGFRLSTLCRKFNEGETYRLANYLTPKLSPSNLMFKDLFFDPSSNKIRPRSTRIDRVITLVSCQQIPPPGAGVDVLDRHVRMCLFDGHNILSNIHSVKVASVDKSQRSWAFSTRVADIMDTEAHAEIFMRTNKTSNNIGILFELCISYSRLSTNEKGVFSCGWVHLPLLDPSGVAVTSRSFDLSVNGGTPYEKGVEVDPTISRRTTSNALVSLISGNKQPRLVIKVNVPRQQHKELMDNLPDTMVGNVSLLPFYSYYRNCLADVLLRDRLDLQSTELLHNPLLKGFPQVADIPDLMRVFRNAWFEKLKAVRRAEKRDEEFMKDLFRQVFLETVYPLSHLATLPAFRMGDDDNEKIRQENVTQFSEAKKNGGKSPLATLLSANLIFQPFTLDEVSYSVIGSHCLQKQLVSAEG